MGRVYLCCGSPYECIIKDSVLIQKIVNTIYAFEIEMAEVDKDIKTTNFERTYE